MNLENKTTKELESIYQEASRNEQREFNEETIKSFEDVENNVNLTKNKDFYKFWESLNEDK